MSSAPGAEFYYERLERAAALPESQRSSDVAAWLHSNAVMEAAAAPLPELPPGLALQEGGGGQSVQWGGLRSTCTGARLAGSMHTPHASGYASWAQCSLGRPRS